MKQAFTIIWIAVTTFGAVAQIKTSEVSIEAIGEVTTIQGKTGVAMTGNPNFNLTLGANLNNGYTSTPDIASRGIMTHGIGTNPGNLHLHRDDVTITTNDILGALLFTGADGGEQKGAEIRGVASGSWNAGSSAADLAFLTNPTGVAEPVERMRINRHGNVGIGTAEPLSPLHIQQPGPVGLRFSRDANHDDYLLGVAGSQGLYIKNGKDGRDELIFDGTGDLIIPGRIKAQNSSSPPLVLVQQGPNGLNIIRSGHDTYRFQLAGSKGIYIQNATDSRNEMVFDGNGNVGIGTDSPTEKLHVEGRVKAATFLSQQPNEQSAWGLKIEQRSDLSGFITMAGRNLSMDFGWDKALTLGSSHHAQYNGKVLIPGANVGIGTSSPTEKLHVNGKIRATGQVGWSDFVFYDDYQLPTLAEVEQHINEKGHLKDIPSEKDVLENGIDLTEMDSKLLQKIEELTLYLIEQNKKIEQLENEIIKLKSE